MISGELLQQIGNLYGINYKQLKPISEGFQNSVFTSDKIIIRITNSERRSFSDLQNELHYILGLSNTGLSVSLPIPSKNGKMIEEIHTVLVVAFQKAQGKPVDVTNHLVWNTDLFFKWGRYIGKMHQASGQFKGLNRPEWTVEKPDHLFKLLPKIKSKIIKLRYIQLLEKLKVYHKESGIFGLTHNDFHQGNFFVQNGEITVFDFDDCGYHWFAYDLAVSFYHACWQASSFTPEDTQFSNKYWYHFLNGYQLEQPLHKVLLEQIPIFLKIREIFLYVMFLEKWDQHHLEEWQEYTLEDLKIKIERDVPFTGIDNLSEYLIK